MTDRGALDEEIDGLYRLPLAEFTPARNALAARLQKEGSTEAPRVRGLEKPSATAWAVNQAYWRAREAFLALVEAGRRVRAAQLGAVAGEEARRAMRAQREALQAVLKEAEAALEDAGHSVSPAVSRRVSRTLEALAGGGTAAGGPAGRLTADLEPSGFEAFAGQPLATPPPWSGEDVPAADAAGEGTAEAADRQRAQAEAVLRRRRAESAAAGHAEALKRLEGARAEREEARRRLDRAESRLLEAAAAEVTARESAEAAARALAEAEAALPGET